MANRAAYNHFIKKQACLFRCLFWCSVYATGQEQFVPQPAKLLTRFFFTQLTGGIILVNARLDDKKDSLTFVFDTGCGGISIDSTTAALLQLKQQPTSKLIRGIAGVKEVSFANNHCLHLPGLDVDTLNFHINNYELLTSVYGIKIDGIIGYSFLKRYIVKIDYDLQMIEVYSPGVFKYPRGGYLLNPDFSQLAMQQLSIADNRQVVSHFIFDTGAGLCMLLSQDFVTDSLLLKKKRKRYPTEAEGLGGKKPMDLSVVKQVHLGPYRFKNVPVYIFTDDFNVTAYPILGGVIGNDLLRRFNVVLNYQEASIYIKPNKHYLDSFDYAYTGLGIYEIGNAVTVVDIMPGSPAEKAGFITGDIILGVDKVLFKNIQLVKLAFQNASAAVNVIVSRDNDLIVLKLKIKNILDRR
ncbi:aspartyl protease family protein [Parasediminibacterium sp. JCM 36343]|uniref:aspartyl protease family protein n=1 Tax=Parasediminibacterium sp. JCM 36343 TaxID=3374279 RepID=UPI00397DE937